MKFRIKKSQRPAFFFGIAIIAAVIIMGWGLSTNGQWKIGQWKMSVEKTKNGSADTNKTEQSATATTKTIDGDIFYLQRSTSATEIYKISVAGKIKQKIFTDIDESEKIISQGGLTADGQKILLWLAADKTATVGNLYLVKTDGSGQKEKALANFGASAGPVISPDGQKLAAIIFSNAERDFGFNLVVIKIDGSNKEAVYKSPTAIDGLRWNPAGDKLVFATTESGDYHLKSVELKDKAVTDLYNSQKSVIRHPGPAAEKIYFSRLIDDKWRLFVVNWQGEKDEDLSQEAAGNQDGVLISPDSQYLATIDYQSNSEQEQGKLMVDGHELDTADELIAWLK